MTNQSYFVADVQGLATPENTEKGTMSNVRVTNQSWEEDTRNQFVQNTEVSPLFVTHMSKWWDGMQDKDKNLIHRINERVRIGRFMNEELFRDVWQRGLYYCLETCSTKGKYCKFVRDYVERYGKPLEKDTVMYRAVDPTEEDEDSISGGSWTKDIKSAFEYSARFRYIQIYSMTVPKGTKTIHFHGNLIFPESEDLIDTTSVKNDSLTLYATLKKVKQKSYKKWVSYFQKADGRTVPHAISNMYSKELSEMFLYDAA